MLNCLCVYSMFYEINQQTRQLSTKSPFKESIIVRKERASGFKQCLNYQGDWVRILKKEQRQRNCSN